MSIEIVAMKMGASAEAALALENAGLQFGIERALEKAHFLSQIYVESAHFTRTRENLNYSYGGLLSTFGRHRISKEDAHRFGRTRAHPADPEAIANRIYGGTFGQTRLGNIRFGDGWRFIGRGFKQLTGRDNYTRYSLAMYGDTRIVDHPEMLERLPDSALSAGWYWNQRGVGAYALADDVEAVTRAVNGGLNGLHQRTQALHVAKAEFAALLG